MYGYNKLLFVLCLFFLLIYMFVSGVSAFIHGSHPLLRVVFMLLSVAGALLALKQFLAKDLYWGNATLGTLGILSATVIMESVLQFVYLSLLSK